MTSFVFYDSTSWLDLDLSTFMILLLLMLMLWLLQPRAKSGVDNFQHKIMLYTFKQSISLAKKFCSAN